MGVMVALISLCLVLASFYWILVLSQRVKALEGSLANSDAWEIQEQLEDHLKAIREENERFIKEVEERMVKRQDLLSTTADVITTSMPPLSSKTEAMRSTKPALSKEEMPSSHSHDEGMPPLNVAEPIDVMETSLMSKILQLQQQGFSTEKIAKQLDLGKGEVALMLKLHEKR